MVVKFDAVKLEELYVERKKLSSQLHDVEMELKQNPLSLSQVLKRIEQETFGKHKERATRNASAKVAAERRRLECIRNRDSLIGELHKIKLQIAELSNGVRAGSDKESIIPLIMDLCAIGVQILDELRLVNINLERTFDATETIQAEAVQCDFSTDDPIADRDGPAAI